MKAAAKVNQEIHAKLGKISAGVKEWACNGVEEEEYIHKICRSKYISSVGIKDIVRGEKRQVEK